MGLALHVAHRILGQTAPNPAVGAIIADEATGEIIARGWTQVSGRPHAEAHALERAGALAAGKTMYVTLEPCSYHGRTYPVISKTMPCAEAILAAGMRRVVVATQDPNPEIAGRGVEVLRNAGVAVDIGLMGEEARWLTAGHILRMTKGRPLVQLKIAVAGDGLIAPGEGTPVWVTGPEARAYAHLLRAHADAVMVGRKTVEDDNPELTCRLPGLANRSPRRVVLDPKFRISQQLKMFQTAQRVPIIIFGAADADAARLSAGRGGAAGAGRCRRPARARGRLTVAGQGRRDARAGGGRTDHCQRAAGRRPRRRGDHRARHRAAGCGRAQAVRRAGPGSSRRSRPLAAFRPARHRRRHADVASPDGPLRRGRGSMTQPFRYYLRVRYQDCDAQHVVFNSRYSEYADLTSFEFMRAALPRPTDVFDGTFELQTVRQVIEWKSPARSDNVLEISTWVSRIGTTSFVLNCEMRRAGETDVLATTETTYVHVDPKTFTKRAIEPHMRAALEAGARGKTTDHAGYFR